jgi:3-oxoisoapionate kinase
MIVPPLYTFYGDDFTGSTDVLEQLAANGVRAALFLAPPTAPQLEEFPGLEAFGIAGDSRSRSPEWMSQHLPPIFASLRSFRTPIVHYKVCSTFDSSPRHGSIGRAIELGIEAFHPRFVPIVVGSPHLRRFIFEGRLFASAPDGTIHRIDRHPMSRHPVTPMREPDIRRHLQKQTALTIGHIPHTELHTLPGTSGALERELSAGARAILFDTIDSRSLETAADLLWKSALGQPLFCAASSGLTAGLISVWNKHGLRTQTSSPIIGLAFPLLVVSGSCSVATSRQIDWATRNGFQKVHADPAQILDSLRGETYQNDLIRQLTTMLNRGQDAVLYTSVDGTPSEFGGEALGTALGLMLREILAATSVDRVILCGGDTSSHAVQQLGIVALTWKASLQPGAPLCQVHFSDRQSRPLELVLKGGQVGSDDFFVVAKGTENVGTTAPTTNHASRKP